MQSKTLTAAIIIIGNEILSGKTQDLNIQFLAKELANLGIRLREVRVIPDVENDIIEVVNLLRVKYSYVFTTGGIGPTHDDITSETIAKAFKEEYILHPEAKTIMEQYLLEHQREIKPGHIRMAYMPKSAVMLLNHETGAPGFKIDNVFVMAGVPYIMQSIFMEAKKFLEVSRPIVSREIQIYVSEDSIAKPFGDLQNKYPEIEMGSYPFKQEERWGTSLVLRGDNPELLDKVMDELLKILANIH